MDTQFSKTRVTIKTPWVDSALFRDFVADVDKMFKDEFGDRAEITATGISALLSRVITAALHSMAKSYVIAFIIITFMMILLVGDVKLGLVSMIPNMLPIVTVMGIIGILGIRLNINTLFIGSIAIGIVVDDTVHFMHNFTRYFERTGNAYKAVKETMLGTGRAMLITSLVLGANFFFLLFATLKNSTRFGVFTGVAIFLALLADFLVAPALMVILTRAKKERVTNIGEPVPVEAH